MMEEAFIGASTETPAPYPKPERPSWVQVTLIDKCLHVACMRCVAHETVDVKGEALLLVDRVAHVIRKHSLCTSFREAV